MWWTLGLQKELNTSVSRSCNGSINSVIEGPITFDAVGIGDHRDGRRG